jgi:hypothetical protein
LDSLLDGEVGDFSASPFGWLAGSCLAALEERFADDGIGVVLGETSSEFGSIAEGDSEPFMMAQDCEC